MIRTEQTPNKQSYLFIISKIIITSIKIEHSRKAIPWARKHCFQSWEFNIFTFQIFTCSASFDGTINVLCDAERPINLLIGENDEYYGSTALVNTYKQISSLYKQKGLGEDIFSRLITFDNKDSNYFSSKRANNQHGGGGYLFCKDELIMNQLFSQKFQENSFKFFLLNCSQIQVFKRRLVAVNYL